MNDPVMLTEVCKNLQRNCMNCGACIEQCPMLQSIGEEISAIATRQPTVAEAFSCSLCGLCETVCPVNLSPKNMFAAKRMAAVEQKEIAIEDYRYMFPDRPNNTMSIYRELNNITYADCHLNEKLPVAFFPGCTMLTYGSELTRELYKHLKQEYECLTLLPDCCGLPLCQLGMRSRGTSFAVSLKEKMLNLEIRKLILACPNCYYHLRQVLADTAIELVTVYEALATNEVVRRPVPNAGLKVTVHDSCPDRKDRIFAEQVRKALVQKGYELKEMRNSKEFTNCCGSGGHVSHFRPELAKEVTRARVAQAKETGADILAAYCMSCVLNFASVPDNLKTQHALNLLLEFPQHYENVKLKAKAMFEGSDGQKIWERVMAEESK